MAALRGLPDLFRAPPTLHVVFEKPWKLGWLEFREFIPRVSEPDQVLNYVTERAAKLGANSLPVQPYIVAVGLAWTEIKQYLLVVSPKITYSFPSIRQAIKVAFEVYWALFASYSLDYSMVWMVIQKCIYEMNSQYDTNPICLQEVLSEFDADTS